MRVIITGLPLFGKYLAKGLTKVDKENSYKFYNTYYSKKDKIRFFIAVLFADIVVSCKGVSEKSKALDWALFLKKKILMQWQGTDVLEAINRSRSNSINNKYIVKSTHVTDATWLQEELSSININADLLDYKCLKIPVSINREKQKSVLSYVGKNNEQFYGVKSLVSLAKDNPSIHFDVVGTDGKNCEIQPNILYHGWVSKNKLNELMDKAKLVLRLTEHDGNSLNVMEALLNGNEVIWTCPHSLVNYYDGNNLQGLFTEVLNKEWDESRYQNAVEYFRKKHDKKKVLNTFVDKLKDLGHQ